MNVFSDSLVGHLCGLFPYYQMQEFRSGGNRHALEAEHAKEEAKRFKTQLAELREKLNDLEAKVKIRRCFTMINRINIFINFFSAINQRVTWVKRSLF